MAVMPPAITIHAISTAIQSVANVTTAQVVTFNLVDVFNGIWPGDSGSAYSTTSFQRVILPQIGDYRVFTSLQFSIGTTSLQTFTWWLKLNGNNVAFSGAQLLAAMNNTSNVLMTSREHIVQCTVPGTDYVEVWMAGTHTTVQLTPSAATTGPPSVPGSGSIVVVVSQLGCDQP